MYIKKAQENPDKYGKNGGKSWSEEEHEKLLKEVKNKTIAEIAVKHERTENAISARLKYLARKMINDGNSIEEAQKKVKLVSVEDIQKFIDSESHKIDVKKNNKEIIKEVKNNKKDDLEEDYETLKNKIKILEQKQSVYEDRILDLETKVNILIEGKTKKKIKV